jgi:uncharacterized membrane protein
MTAEVWSGIIGLILPFVSEYLQKAGVKGNRLFNFVIAAIVSIVVGGVASFLKGNFSFSDPGVLLGSIGAAFVAAQTAYNVYFKPLNLDLKIQGVTKGK